MLVCKHLSSILLAVTLVFGSAAALDARSRKGDKFYALGIQAEQEKQRDKALEYYQQALAEDPSDIRYRIALMRARFQAGQAHTDAGEKLRSEGKLEEAAAEFERAYAIDPSSAMALQDLNETREILERLKTATGETAKLLRQGLTPAEIEQRKLEQKLETVEAVPQLKPLSQTPITLKINNQPPKVVFETIGKLAGINVLFDPDFQPQMRGISLDLNNATLDQALDYASIITKSFWKPISENAVFIAQDTQPKRQEFEDQVAKVFYLNNVTTPQELNEITGALRGVANTQRAFISASQSAIIVRGTADQVALAELLIHDLDRPRPEVVVDVIVMEVSRDRTRDLAAALTSGSSTGISVPIQFTPRNPVLQGGTGSGSGGSGGSGSGSGTTTTSNQISLAQLGKISTNDFSITLPGAILQAMMTDSSTSVLQSPQVRAVDSQKASLKIGERFPYSTGGFQPAFGQVGTGFNSLYSSFQFLDVGVNVDITPKVHNSREVSLHIELDISNVRGSVDIGGISQPIVGQRKVVHDIRLQEGEISLLGGLLQDQQTKSIAGIPGLSSIPIIRRLFTTDSVDRSNNELVIALVPHIVRMPSFDNLSYKDVAVGTERSVKLNFAPEKPAAPAAEAPKSAIPAPAPPEAAPTPEQPKPEAQAPGPPAPSPGAAASVAFSPPTVSAQAGATFTVGIQVENVTNLFAAPLQIKFDPTILRLNEVGRGDFLAQGGQVLFTRNILNDTGDASVNLSRMPGAGSASGSGTLVTFTFQALRAGTTTIAATRLALQDAQGQPILTATPQVTVNIK